MIGRVRADDAATHMDPRAGAPEAHVVFGLWITVIAGLLVFHFVARDADPGHAG